MQKLRYAVTSWERDGKAGALKQVQRPPTSCRNWPVRPRRSSRLPRPRRRIPRPHLRPPPEPKTIVAAGTMGMAILIGQLVSVLFLTYFLLAAGDLFRRRLMQVMEPSARGA